jgi:hypothetical protein
MLKPEDEFIHSYPKNTRETWKENWYFNFIDREKGIWGFNHLSLVRNKGKARFTAAHVVQGQTRIYSNVIDIPGSFPGNLMTDGVVAINCLEPLQAYQSDYRGKDHELLLKVEGRFPLFDYEHNLQDEKDTSLSMAHYEQSCRVTGVLRIKGKEISVDCLGQRDHSWGFREESKIKGWNWLVGQFDDCAVNIMITRKVDETIPGGFISNSRGGVRIVSVEVRTEYEADGRNPLASTYTAQAEDGRMFRIQSKKFSQIQLPVQKGAFVYENFAEFTLLETGQKGSGVEEHLLGQ